MHLTQITTECHALLSSYSVLLPTGQLAMSVASSFVNDGTARYVWTEIWHDRITLFTVSYIEVGVHYLSSSPKKLFWHSCLNML